MEDFLKKVEEHYNVVFIDSATCDTGKIISSQTSMSILDYLAKTDRQIGLTANELSEKLDIARTTVIYHLGRLQQCGLVDLNPVLADENEWNIFWNNYRNGLLDLTTSEFNKIHDAKGKNEKLYLLTKRGIIFVPAINREEGESMIKESFAALPKPVIQESFQRPVIKKYLAGFLGLLFIGITFGGIFLFMEYSDSSPTTSSPISYNPPVDPIVTPKTTEIDCDSIPPWGIARLDLEGAIESGDLSTAREAYVKLIQYYDESRYCVSMEHMEFVAPKKKMDSLKKNLDNGDLNSAQDDLYYLASSCGAAICHRKKSTMVDLEISYFDIKDNIDDGNLIEAKNSFMNFQKAYYGTKDEFRRVIPMESSMMDDKYVDNLNDALANNDLVASKRAVSEMQDGVCSSKGCHGGMVP